MLPWIHPRRIPEGSRDSDAADRLSIQEGSPEKRASYAAGAFSSGAGIHSSFREVILLHTDNTLATDPTGSRAPEKPGGLVAHLRARLRRDLPLGEKVLVLTPVKDAEGFLDGYFRLLRRLAYPHRLISLGFLESDSSDRTWEALRRKLPGLRREFRRAEVWKRDFGYHLPPGIHRGAAPIQVERRAVLARSRNHLLSRALADEDWVLWLDVDLIDYPADIVERLLATGKEIVQPHCVLDYGGRTFDTNGWRDHGRLHLDDLRSEGELVELDAVGGTMLWVRADLHRDGLIFPAFRYGLENPLGRPGRGELETEGLGMMARDMGYRCWGMPNLEIRHRRG